MSDPTGIKTEIDLTGSKMNETLLKETGQDHVINFGQTKGCDCEVLDLTGRVGVGGSSSTKRRASSKTGASVSPPPYRTRGAEPDGRAA